MKIENVKITDFAKRHFDSKFGGTKILDYTPEEFERILSLNISALNLLPTNEYSTERILPGYADFCKLVVLKNFTDARTGTLPITLDNYQYLRSGYSARREGEFEIFSRWLELPIAAPKAKYIVVVLYSKEQIDKEAFAEYNKKIAEDNTDSVNIPDLFTSDYGVVAILGQMSSEEEPMKPETFDRNYMPIEFGGSGMSYPIMPIKSIDSVDIESIEIYNKQLAKYKNEIDKIKYERKKCVDFWDKNITVK